MTDSLGREFFIGSRKVLILLKLALVTPDSKFYHSKPDRFPFPDPYWAFYWPGGQALTRYILDSADVDDSYGRTLDFGCGCGSASMAILLRDHKASVTAGIES